MSDCSNWHGDRIKATVDREFIERRSGDSGAWSVRREDQAWNFSLCLCVRQSSVRGCRFSFVFVYFIIKVC